MCRQLPPVHAKETCLVVVAVVFLMAAFGVLVAGFGMVGR